MNIRFDVRASHPNVREEIKLLKIGRKTHGIIVAPTRRAAEARCREVFPKPWKITLQPVMTMSEIANADIKELTRALA